jgi:hypothetical protein
VALGLVLSAVPAVSGGLGAVAAAAPAARVARLISDVELQPRLHELTIDSPAIGGSTRARLIVPRG